MSRIITAKKCREKKIYSSITAIKHNINNERVEHLGDIVKAKNDAEQDLNRRIDDLGKHLLKSEFSSEDINLDEPLGTRNTAVIVSGALTSIGSHFSTVSEIDKLKELKEIQDRALKAMFSFMGLLDDDNLTANNAHEKVITSSYCLLEHLNWYYGFVRRLEEILGAKRLLKTLSERVDFLLSLIKKRLRNLRRVFNKQHSFHFKNLDDYYDTSINLSF